MLSGAKDYLCGPGVSGDWTPCGPKAREDELLAAAGFQPVRVPASPVRHVPNMQFILFAEKVLKRAGVYRPDIPVSGVEAVMEVEVRLTPSGVSPCSSLSPVTVIHHGL